jgi:hypothetical protein
MVAAVGAVLVMIYMMIATLLFAIGIAIMFAFLLVKFIMSIIRLEFIETMTTVLVTVFVLLSGLYLMDIDANYFLTKLISLDYEYLLKVFQNITGSPIAIFDGDSETLVVASRIIWFFVSIGIIATLVLSKDKPLTKLMNLGITTLLISAGLFYGKGFAVKKGVDFSYEVPFIKHSEEI